MLPSLQESGHSCGVGGNILSMAVHLPIASIRAFITGTENAPVAQFADDLHVPL